MAKITITVEDGAGDQGRAEFALRAAHALAEAFDWEGSADGAEFWTKVQDLLFEEAGTTFNEDLEAHKDDVPMVIPYMSLVN